MTFRPLKNWKPDSLWDAIIHYNFPFDYVRVACQNYLFDFFLTDLIDKFNEDKKDEDKFDWYTPNEKFIQFAYDYLDLLFKKE